MKRTAASLLVLGVIVLAVLFPVWSPFGGDVEPADDPTTITGYVADFRVDADGVMQVTETITVDFPSYPDRRGIFRYFDEHDDNATDLRRVPRGIGVTRDGSSEPFVTLSEGGGRYTVLRIGSEGVIVTPGEHTYTIRYAIDDVLLPTSDDGESRFYWNLVPGGWDQAIERASLTVDLPAEAGDVRCAVGSGGTTGCTPTGEGTTRLQVVVTDLDPRTPVTLSTTLPLPAPEAADRLWWSGRWDPVLGQSLPVLLLVLGAAAVAGLVGVRVARTAHETTPAYPLLYAPPEGIGPAQAQYLLDERVDRTAFVATMMYAAERGAVDLSREGARWRMAPTGEPAAVDRLDPVTRQVVSGLGIERGASFVAGGADLAAGKRLRHVVEEQERGVEEWAAREQLMTSSGLGSAGGIVVVVAALAALVVAVVNPLSMSVLALVPAAFAAGALSLVLRGSGTRRTRAGRDLWSRLGGFRRVLSTPSSQLRFDFSARRELYTAYLPWAVAFGVADAWAAKYRTEMGTEPPAPAYFAGGYAGAHTGNHVDQMVHDLDAAVDSSIAAYEASLRPQSSGGGSGSSGGGGFSGGGGGGGGGGGSW